MFFVFLLLALTGNPQANRLAPNQSTHLVKRYQVTLRVIRPTWRKQPTVDEMKSSRGQYGNIISGVFHPKYLDSDSEMLNKLNKHSPEFKFDRFLNKTSFILAADTVWTAPKDFSLNDFQLAFVQNKVELVDVTSPASGPIVGLGKPNPTSQSQFPQYSKEYPPAVRKQIEEDGKVILTRTATLNSLVEGKKREYSRMLGGGYVIEKNATTCIIYNLNVYTFAVKGKKPQVVFNPSDIVLLTVSDAK